MGAECGGRGAGSGGRGGAGVEGAGSGGREGREVFTNLSKELDMY